MTKQDFDVESCIDQMNDEERKNILINLLKTITDSKNAGLRENCLKIVLWSNMPEVLDSIDY